MCRRVISAAAEVFDSSTAEDDSAAAPLVTTEDQVMPQHCLCACLMSWLIAILGHGKVIVI